MSFRKLSCLLSHIFIDSEKQSIDYECRLYQAQSYTANENVYSFDTQPNKMLNSLTVHWYKVFEAKDLTTNKQKNPELSKLVKACLRCFHGPLVESAFNLMDTIVTDSRTSLKIDSLNAVQTVKYDFMSSRLTACEKYGSENPNNVSLNSDLMKNVVSSRKAYQQDLQDTSANPSTVTSSLEQSRDSKSDVALLSMENKTRVSSIMKRKSDSKSGRTKKKQKTKVIFYIMCMFFFVY